MSKQKKYHYIYKTTCQITGKFYVGMHSTDNLEDGYLGSGKILGYSRNKYGDENHIREIVEFLLSRDELKVREKEIVNDELMAHPLNINLKYGGEGGWPVNSLEHQSKAGRLGGLKTGAANIKSINTPVLIKKRTEKMIANGTYKRTTLIWGNASQTKEANSKRIATFAERCHSQGEKNSQFGSCWVTNGIKPIKIKKEQLAEYLLNGYSRGRK